MVKRPRVRRIVSLVLCLMLALPAGLAAEAAEVTNDYQGH